MSQTKSLFLCKLTFSIKSSINKNVICDIECNEFDNVDFCNITRLGVRPLEDNFLLNASYIHATIWRYFALADNFVDVVSFRDADSYILQREVDSVNTWLKSDKIVHLMRGFINYLNLFYTLF